MAGLKATQLQRVATLPPAPTGATSVGAYVRTKEGRLEVEKSLKWVTKVWNTTVDPDRPISNRVTRAKLKDGTPAWKFRYSPMTGPITLWF
jgi:hypothetical protein